MPARHAQRAQWPLPARMVTLATVSTRTRKAGARAAEPIRLERFLPYRLSVLSNAVSTAIAAEYAQQFDLTIPEWRVLAVLARHPGLSAAGVAAQTRMDAVAVSRAVARLMRSGRLRRATASDDRRRSVLRLSSAGLAVYGAVAPVALRFERDLLATLSQRDRAMLDRLLERLLGRAEALAYNPRPVD